MGDSVYFATVENGSSSSGFNGLPFRVPFFDRRGDPFEEWDGETFFGSFPLGTPSKSATESIPVFGVGSNYMGPFSLQQLSALILRIKKFDVVVTGEASAAVIFGPVWGWVGGGNAPTGTRNCGVSFSPPDPPLTTSPSAATRELKICTSSFSSAFGGLLTSNPTGSFHEFMFTQTVPGPEIPQFDGDGNFIGFTYGPDLHQDIYIDGSASGSMGGAVSLGLSEVIGVMSPGNTEIVAANYYVKILSASFGASLNWSAEATSGWGSIGGGWSASSSGAWNYDCAAAIVGRNALWPHGWEQVSDYVITLELNGASWEVRVPVYVGSNQFTEIAGILSVDIGAFDPGTMRIIPTTFWPYKNSLGNPVWDADTGENIAPVS